MDASTSKVWLLIGITGQDGSLFADLLLEKGYTNIHGTIRRCSTFNTMNIDHIFDKLTLHYVDLMDSASVREVIRRVNPDYIVNFAAQSHVKVSSELESYTLHVNTLGVLNILQSMKIYCKHARLYQCGTSEEFGNEYSGKVLDYKTVKKPVSVYGVSKLAAENLCDMYRDAYSMYIVCGTLFNHESPRRGGTFVTKKICDYIKKINDTGKVTSPLLLGNLNAMRDWGYAKDYCEAIYLMLTQDCPKNYIVSTGEMHSVREFVERAFKQKNICVRWQGTGINEVGVNQETDDIVVKVAEKYYRDIDINNLIGDSTPIRETLGWKPSVTFDDLIKLMVNP